MRIGILGQITSVNQSQGLTTKGDSKSHPLIRQGKVPSDMHHATPLSFQSGTPEQEPAEISPNADPQSADAEPDPAKSGSLLADHKGKLAVGAAAMLGIAIFYKWREHRLAKEDPEQYAQLKRIKSAVRDKEAKD
jgi:hypothetical protein